MATTLETPCLVFRSWVEQCCAGPNRAEQLEAATEEVFAPPETPATPIEQAAAEAPPVIATLPLPEPRTTTKPPRHRRPVEGVPIPPRFGEPQLLVHYRAPAPRRRPAFNPINQLGRLIAAFR